MASKQNLQPLLDVRQNQLSLLLSASDALDSKALAILGFNAAAIIFILQSSLMELGWIVILPLIPFIASLSFAMWASWPQEQPGAGIDLSEHPEYLSMDEEDLTLQLLADTEEAIRMNTPINATKSRRCSLSIIISMLGIIMLVPYLVQGI